MAGAKAAVVATIATAIPTVSTASIYSIIREVSTTSIAMTFYLFSPTAQWALLCLK